MFFPEGNVRVFLYGKPVDMRKSFDGLRALVKHALEENPLSGSLFVFVNRRSDYVKALYWDRTGYCIWSKRLEQGRFRRTGAEPKQLLSWLELKLWLEGIDGATVKRQKRFQR